jgi:hypothetical protein
LPKIFSASSTAALPTHTSITRGLVGGLHLAEDLRLAEHHALNAAHDAEKVAHALVAAQCVKGRSVADVRAESGESVGGVLGGGVVFHAIAGGDDHRLAEPRRLCEADGDFAKMRVADGELLAKLDRRILVTEAEADDVHFRSEVKETQRAERN